MTVKDVSRIYVISLPNSERRQEVKHEMNKHFIWFNWFDAIENKEDGANGLKETFKKLFTKCLQKGQNNVMVFEDDAMFLCENAYEEIGKVLTDVPENYRIVKFGANLLAPVHRITDNLNGIKLSYALHACLYSKEGMEKILENIDKTDEPIDVIIAKFIEPFSCYVSSKMLVTQRPTKSSIFVYDENKHRNIGDLYEKETGIIRWDKLMKQQWENNTKHLK